MNARRVFSAIGVFALALFVGTALLLALPGGRALAADPPDPDCYDIIKTNDTNGHVDQGDTFTWTVQLFKKSGTACAGSPPYQVNDTIPSAFSIEDFDDTEGDCDQTGNNIECEGSVAGNSEPPGKTLTLFEVTVEAQTCGSKTNTAVLTQESEVGGTDPGAEQDSDTVIVDCDGSITIIKDTNPEGSGGSFGFQIHHVGGGFVDDFPLADDQSATYDLPDGSYRVVESFDGNSHLINISCSGSGSWTDIDNGDNDVEIHIDAGEHVTCVFTNQVEQQVVIVQRPQVIIQQVPVIIQQPAPKPVVQQVQAAQSLPRTGDGSSQQHGGTNWFYIGGALFALAGLSLGARWLTRTRD